MCKVVIYAKTGIILKVDLFESVVPDLEAIRVNSYLFIGLNLFDILYVKSRVWELFAIKKITFQGFRQFPIMCDYDRLNRLHKAIMLNRNK